MVQPSQQYVADSIIGVKEVERELGTRGSRMVATFWADIPVEVT